MPENAAAIKNLPAEVELEYAQTAEESLAKQWEVEAADACRSRAIGKRDLSPERRTP